MKVLKLQVPLSGRSQLYRVLATRRWMGPVLAELMAIAGHF